MIVMRVVHTAKRGQREELIAFAKEFTSKHKETSRVYRCMIGDQDAIASEVEFEDLAHYDRWLKENVTNSKSQAGNSPLFELSTGGHNDIWELVE